MKKHFFLLFLLPLLPMLAMADDSGSCGENVTWTYIEANHTLKVQGSGAMNNYSWTGEIPWYNYREQITTVMIDDGVTSIGIYAFNFCSGLTSVTIGNSVTSIGDYAFFFCSGLTSVDIPNSVKSIGEYAFQGCSGITSVTIGNSVTSIGIYAFNGCSGLTSVIVENGNNIYDSRNNCNAIIETATNELILGCSTTVIPNSVKSIGYMAFYGCSGLTSVTIGNSVTSIGNNAFSYCSGLTSVIVENGNNKYDSRNNCNAIIETATNELILGCSTTVIPNSVTAIGDQAFYGCSGLTSIDIPNSVTSIGNAAFDDCSGLTSVTIGNSVTAIGRSAFYVCSGLTSVIVENGNIKYDSRNNCNAIIETATNELILGCSTTVIPNSVTSIGSSAFFGCSGLTSIDIPNSVTAIGSSAFSDCSGLTSVTIPNSVTSIGSYAFASCEKLTTVNAMMTNPPESKYAFGYEEYIYQTATLYVPVGCKDIYSNTGGWKRFMNIEEKDFGAGVPEDLNGDGKVDALDIQSVINACAGNDADTKFDVNGDGKVDALDIQQVINVAAASE